MLANTVYWSERAAVLAAPLKRLLVGRGPQKARGFNKGVGVTCVIGNYETYSAATFGGRSEKVTHGTDAGLVIFLGSTPFESLKNLFISSPSNHIPSGRYDPSRPLDHWCRPAQLTFSPHRDPSELQRRCPLVRHTSQLPSLLCTHDQRDLSLTTASTNNRHLSLTARWLDRWYRSLSSRRDPSELQRRCPLVRHTLQFPSLLRAPDPTDPFATAAPTALTLVSCLTTRPTTHPRGVPSTEYTFGLGVTHHRTTATSAPRTCPPPPPPSSSFSVNLPDTCGAQCRGNDQQILAISLHTLPSSTQTIDEKQLTSLKDQAPLHLPKTDAPIPVPSPWERDTQGTIRREAQTHPGGRDERQVRTEKPGRELLSTVPSQKMIALYCATVDIAGPPQGQKEAHLDYYHLAHPLANTSPAKDEIDPPPGSEDA
eukprot:g20499.t1